MPYNMLIAAGPNVKSGWVHVDPTQELGPQIGISYAQHGANGGNVIIEQLVQGTPGFGVNSPYSPQLDTGTVAYLATIPLDGTPYDVSITTPIEYIRARTDAGLLGTVDVNMTQNS